MTRPLCRSGLARLGLQGYRAFIALVEGYFNTRNIDIDIDSAQGVVKPELDSVALSSVFGLQNIAQVCRQADRDQWRGLIEAHFDSIFTVHGQDNALEIDTADFAQIERSLRARLYPSEITSHTAEIVQRPARRARWRFSPWTCPRRCAPCRAQRRTGGG